MNRRDKIILEKMMKHCDEVAQTHQLFHEDKDLFFNKKRGFIYRNAIAMPILQIGELAKSLSPAIRQSHDDIPWHDIVGMRDIVVHHYGALEYDTIWNTSQNDVPALLEKLSLILDAEGGDPNAGQQ